MSSLMLRREKKREAPRKREEKIRAREMRTKCHASDIGFPQFVLRPRKIFSVAPRARGSSSEWKGSRRGTRDSAAAEAVCGSARGRISDFGGCIKMLAAVVSSFQGQELTMIFTSDLIVWDGAGAGCSSFSGDRGFVIQVFSGVFVNYRCGGLCNRVICLIY